ncbi:hypothetical protein KC959_00305 [Candidatus Saccharibacteria bacterium]|nr:hypothetical protein [Candidatus Saccharibacteria bacterium]
MSEHASAPMLKDIQPVRVGDGETRYQDTAHGNKFVSSGAVEQARRTAKGALYDTVNELQDYGHDVTKGEYKQMADELGLPQEHMKWVGGSAAQVFDKEGLYDAAYEHQDPTADEAAEIQTDQAHAGRQAEYDSMAAEIGSETQEEQNGRVKAAIHRRKNAEHNAANIADNEARGARNALRLAQEKADAELISLEDSELKKKSLTELANLLGQEKASFKVSKAEYIQMVKDKQSEIKSRAPQEAPHVAVPEPTVSNSTRDTIEAMKSFHRGDMYGETSVKKAYEDSLKQDINDLLDLAKIKYNGDPLSEEQQEEMKVLARLIQSSSSTLDVLEGLSVEQREVLDKEMTSYLDAVTGSEDVLNSAEANFDESLAQYKELAKLAREGKMTPEQQEALKNARDKVLAADEVLNKLEGLDEDALTNSSLSMQDYLDAVLADDDKDEKEEEAGENNGERLGDDASDELHSDGGTVEDVSGENKAAEAQIPEKKKRHWKRWGAGLLTLVGLSFMAQHGLSGDDDGNYNRETSTTIETTPNTVVSVEDSTTTTITEAPESSTTTESTTTTQPENDKTSTTVEESEDEETSTENSSDTESSTDQTDNNEGGNDSASESPDNPQAPTDQVNVSDWTWKVANNLAPGHADELIQKALDAYNATNATHFVLTPHNGSTWIMDGNRAVNQAQMEAINQLMLSDDDEVTQFD